MSETLRDRLETLEVRDRLRRDWGWHATHHGAARSLAGRSSAWARLVQEADAK